MRWPPLADRLRGARGVIAADPQAGTLTPREQMLMQRSAPRLEGGQINARRRT